MQFLNQVQAAVLFDRSAMKLADVAQAFVQSEEKSTGARYNLVESNPGLFYRLFGTNELMVTIEYLDKPAARPAFDQALGSAITKILFPTIQERLDRHRSHVIINVSHGALPDSAQLQSLLAALGPAGAGLQKGATFREFKQRLETCALLCRLAQRQGTASVVHWTQSNTLLSTEAFEQVGTEPAPSMLHIHPYLFGPGPAADGRAMVGIRTFGARHFLGREILIEPNPISFDQNLSVIVSFVRIATMENGYVIPDGDTFGPEDRSQSYRVHHRPAAPGDVPLYEIEPLLHREQGFESKSYAPPGRVLDRHSPDDDLLPPDPAERARVLDELEAKRRQAERIGAMLEVSPRQPATDAPATSWLNRPVFGRKKPSE